MKLTRKISQDLLAWKNRKDRRALLIKGARQVGKTYSIEEFARTHYKHFIKINFDENPAYKVIFDGDLDVTTLIKQISLRVPGAEMVPHETLILLDEIQHCPKARTALKFLALDRRFDVIASGSMLGIHYKEVPSFPVGFTDPLEMHSLDFEEFLWASGVKPQSINDLKEYFTRIEPVPTAMHQRMLELFKEYIIVGGMPRVVSTFMETSNFADVLRIQKAIIADYTDDIAKYAEGNDKTKARACFLSIPKHLSKDYKKFRYSLVEPQGSARKYGGSLQWLYDAGIINYCYNLAAIELPFEGNARSDVFKIYMRDTGLLMAMLEDGSQADVMEGNLGIYKGAIYENIIADIFTKAQKKLYYFEHNSQVEMDFFIRHHKLATAIEVKSGENVKSKSMTTMIQRYGVQQGVKLSSKNIGKSDKIISYPLYMAMFL